MFDFEFLNSHVKQNDFQLAEVSFQILKQKCDQKCLEVSESEKVIISRLLREFRKMSELNLERLMRTLKLGNLEQSVLQYIMKKLKERDENMGEQELLLEDRVNKLDYEMIKKMEWKVDVQVQSDCDKKPRVFVVLNIETEKGRFVYRLDPKQFQQFRLQVAQLYYQSIDD